MTQSFYRRADGVVISFDVTDKQTFQNVRNWVESINAHAAKNAARVLVGNKIDLTDDREVSRAEAEELAQQYGIHYHETSAKANLGLKETFEDIFEQSYKNKFISATKPPEEARQSVKISSRNQAKEKKRCCGGS